jgi:hypothetical protein
MAKTDTFGQVTKPLDTLNEYVATPPTEFVYQHDMDENGALFFLGSRGKQKHYQNPHTL